MTAARREPSLRELADGAGAAGRLALDTEFMGEGRYRTLLCLVQLAIPEGQGPGERIAIIDPLGAELDAAALTAVLADPAVRIVVHAGRQDVALIRRRFATDVTNVFDTQIAAAFAGLGAQSSYDSLLAALLGLRLAKTASFTRWDARPLSAEQIAYAREDVVHLLDLAAELERRLEALGRLQWALEECRTVALSSDERDPDTILRRLPRIATLNARAAAVARELVLWREATAERHDRPVQSVLGDAPLVELARRAPTSREALARIRGLGGVGGRRGEDLLEVIRRGRERPPGAVPMPPRPPAPKPDDAPLVALAEALVRARASEAGLAYELLASRSELQAILTAVRSSSGEPDVRVLEGWRRELAGAELLELLAGGVSLSVAGAAAEIRVRVSSSDGGGASPRRDPA